VQYGAPQGSHDDCVMALALAWFGASNQSARYADLDGFEIDNYVNPWR
jgi:hypothetical protein